MGELNENTSEFYYERLTSSTNPGLVLAQFYGNTFSREITKSEIIIFNKLLRLYGRFVVYFSILDMSSMSDINFENIFPLLSFFCKKRLEQKYGITLVEGQDLNKVATNIEKQIEKQAKSKIVIKDLDNE